MTLKETISVKYLSGALAFILCIATSTELNAQDVVQIGLFTFYKHRDIHRGALIWDNPTAGAFPAITLFDTLSVGWGTLTFSKDLNENHKISFGNSFWDDDEPQAVFRINGGEEDFKNQRQGTYGVFFKYRYKLPGWFRYSIMYEKDLNEHYGDYLYGTLAITVVPLFRFGVGVGLSDGQSARYLYGPEALNGTGHYDYYAQFFLPFLPYGGVFVLRVIKTRIPKRPNQQADYIRGNSNNSSFAARIMYNF